MGAQTQVQGLAKVRGDDDGEKSFLRLAHRFRRIELSPKSDLPRCYNGMQSGINL